MLRTPQQVSRLNLATTACVTVWRDSAERGTGQHAPGRAPRRGDKESDLRQTLETRCAARVCSSKKLGGLGLLWRLFLNRCDVQAGYDHAALVVEPHHDPAALGIDGGVVGAGDPIPIPAACDDDKRLKGPRLQKLTNISDHLQANLLELAHSGKPV